MAGPEHGGVDAVGQQADDAVDVARPGLQFGLGQGLVVFVGPDDLVPGLQQRIGPRRASGGG